MRGRVHPWQPVARKNKHKTGSLARLLYYCSVKHQYKLLCSEIKTFDYY